VAVLSLRLLSPLPLSQLSALFTRASRLLVAEQNHAAQFCHYLRAQLPTFEYHSFSRPGPSLILPADLCAFVEDADGH
jgi:hypothetical protein